jgi:hypothetical protein
MSRLFPTFQDFMDLRNGTKVGVTRVTTVSTTDYVILPNATAATVLQSTGTNTGDFYLGPGGNSLQLDSVTAGDEFIITSLHKGWTNFGSET